MLGVITSRRDELLDRCDIGRSTLVMGGAEEEEVRVYVWVKMRSDSWPSRRGCCRGITLPGISGGDLQGVSCTCVTDMIVRFVQGPDFSELFHLAETFI